MRWFLFPVAVAALLAASPGLFSQPAPTPGQRQPGNNPGGAGTPAAVGPKVCVTEMKATTRVVHGSVCKEYCRPRSSVVDFFRACCGLGCGDCECGDVKTRRVLTKMSVPGPEQPVCVLKDLSALPPGAAPIPSIKGGGPGYP